MDGLRPRLTPTHARGSMSVFEYCSRGLTAKARQPNGIMDITRGLSPVSISYDVTFSSGPLVRLSTSTAMSNAKGQSLTGTAPDTRYERASSETERIDLSATPLSWCT